MSEWIKCSVKMPKRGSVVLTKTNGLRGSRKYLWVQGLWWMPDRSRYIYTAPTHWQPFPEPPRD